jgi:lipopolysaccharide transport system permease protein
MRVRYQNLRADVASDRTLLIQFRIQNQSSTAWHRDGGFLLGWQIYDPLGGTFIFEGDQSPLPADLGPGESTEVSLRIQLPAEDGPYRVYISPIHPVAGWFYANGTPFVLVDARVANGSVNIQSAGVTTLRTLGWKTFLQSIPKAFEYPVLSVWRNRTLIRSMVRRDILARYRGSFGDVLWTVLNPILLMSTYFFVFGVVQKTQFAADPSRTGFTLYFLAGMLPWLAFSEPLGRAPYVILEYRSFVKKFVFPLETLSVNQVISGFVTEFFGLIIFFAFLLIARGSVPLSVLWLPVLIIPQILFTLGLCWFLAALGAFMRDLGQLMGFLLTLWFFTTPICYPEISLPKDLLWILGKNPMFTLVRSYRAVLLEGHAPEFGPMWKFWLISIVFCILGHACFHKLRKSFADVI